MNEVSAVIPAVMGVAALLAGCGTPPSQSPQVLAIDRAQYTQAFDAAVEIAGDVGMPAALRDRDGGVIETRANVAGSVLEPWDWPHGGVGEALGSTIAFQRRRARFEFVPSGFRPTVTPEEVPLLGQSVPGSVPSDAGGAVDLRSYEGPIDLRIWVFVERAFTPGLQRGTWTLTQTSITTDPIKNRPVGDGTTRDRSVWTPIERDEVMERELMEKMRARLAS